MTQEPEKRWSDTNYALQNAERAVRAMMDPTLEMGDVLIHLGTAEKAAGPRLQAFFKEFPVDSIGQDESFYQRELVTSALCEAVRDALLNPPE